MTRVHFTALAALINTELSHENPTVEGLAEALADYLDVTMPRFDRDRFLTACGVLGRVPA